MKSELASNANVDWDLFNFVDSKINLKTGKPYYQQYLKPSLYVEIYFDYTQNKFLKDFYQSLLDKIGHLFNYHNNNNKSRESKIQDREKVLNLFLEFLDSRKTYLWQNLSDIDGVGGKELGGIGEASFTCWIHKRPLKTYSTKERRKVIENYEEILKELKTNMLPGSILPISRIRVTLPINSFEDAEEFKEWLFSNKLLKKGVFFSGSAGYSLNQWEGYNNSEAENKALWILKNYPGFDYDFSPKLGRSLSQDKSFIVPEIKRVNWLNFINKQAIEVLGGEDKLKNEINQKKNLKSHVLKEGLAIQAGESPQLSQDKIGQYHELGKILSPIHYYPHPKDHYEKEVKEWLYLFDNY